MSRDPSVGSRKVTRSPTRACRGVIRRSMTRSPGCRTGTMLPDMTTRDRWPNRVKIEMATRSAAQNPMSAYRGTATTVRAHRLREPGDLGLCDRLGDWLLDRTG